MANRQFKDSVFRKLFNNRKELAKLYQAIQPGIVVSPQDLKITTLRNVFLDSQKNDLSFLWKGTSVVLIEHQMTRTAPSCELASRCGVTAISCI